MADVPAAVSRKLIAPSQAGSYRWPRPLVFTNGVFDVLHRGHVLYLAAARELGAALLVGVNSDSSARQLGKGPGRPLNREVDRLLLIAALESVSFVTTFEESTPCELLQRCRPDVYVKGGDYDVEALEETRLMRSWGGRSVSIPFVEGYSTSGLVQRIRGSS
ncbi:MAG: adenylyltransferase/cytidyltransferase family protein [Steroidobacteraceae bacterium]